jgi:transposase
VSEPLEVDFGEVDRVLERVQPLIAAPDHRLLTVTVHAFRQVTVVLDDKTTTIGRMRQMIFGKKSEKSRDVLKPTAASTERPPREKPKRAAPPRGHGRNSLEAYSGAAMVCVEHPQFEAGERCPECQKGKLHPFAPTQLIRITGQAALSATRFVLEKLRCGLCGMLFTAPLPAGVGKEKYAPSAVAMLAVVKYQLATPSNRLEELQASLGVPLPAGTQAQLIETRAKTLQPVFDALVYAAAQGRIFYNDDTTARVLELMPAARARKAQAPTQVPTPAPAATPTSARKAKAEPPRTGVFTTGIVVTSEEHRIALFFTGQKHAGENLAAVLAHRKPGLPAPIQICDALACNTVPACGTEVAHCNTHARRKMVDIVTRFPEECAWVIGIYRVVYENDQHCKRQELSAEARLAWHQTHSAGPMAELRRWCDEQFAQRRVEPNGALGKAIKYLTKHWDRLTLFLRKAGVPLDTNIVEQTLKTPILIRKNSLFFKTLKGAACADLFMSLIKTCRFHGVDAFHYLTSLLKYPAEIEQAPTQWLPWNYTQTLAALTANTS